MPRLCTLVLPLILIAPALAADAPWLDGQIPGLVKIYTYLHANPELSFKEASTSKMVAAELRGAGAAVTEGVGQFGVVAILENGKGPTVLVRSDLDALPVTEATDLPYASKVTTKDDEGNMVGVMHACGHDVHMTCLIGTARWLAEHKADWKGTVILIGQPAEERIGGAKAMLADGLYTRFPKPDFALALHVSHDLEAGKVAYTSGPAMASSTSVDVHVMGKGGHGAMPHNTVDPIVLAAALVMDLQTIVSREVSPIQPSVITVGSIHGGTKHNIIPNEVRMQLTLRSFDENVTKLLIDGIKRRAEGLAFAHKAPAPKVIISDSTPPTINTPSLVAKVIPFIKASIGDSNVAAVEATMGAEDFGLFGQGGVPTFMFRLGTIPPAKLASFTSKGETPPSLHSALYFPDPEPSIRTGITAMTSAVCGLLPPK